jgi:LPXTG-motif cell wall-anchored protein
MFLRYLIGGTLVIYGGLRVGDWLSGTRDNQQLLIAGLVILALGGLMIRKAERRRQAYNSPGYQPTLRCLQCGGSGWQMIGGHSYRCSSGC